MLTAALSDLNFVAVFVAGLVHMGICIAWFTPHIFGNTWTRLTGKDLKPPARW